MAAWLSGSCQLEMEDGQTALYTYKGDNASLLEGRREELAGQEGMLTIQKRSLEKPGKRVRKIRRKDGGTREVSDPVYQTPDIIGHLEDGDISVELCGVDQDLAEGRDVGQPLLRVPWRLLLAIYQRYMRTGKLPERAEFEQ